MNWKFWRKDAEIVPKDGKKLTQSNPIRAGLYERDVKDIKLGLEKINKSLETAHEDNQTFIDNVLEKETALAEATDARMDYLTVVSRVDEKLNQLGSSMLTLIDELRKQSFKGNNVYAAPPAANGNGAPQPAVEKNAEKTGRTKFPKQEKDHPLFSAAESADESGTAASPESADDIGDLESKIQKTINAEFGQLKVLFLDTIKEFKAFRADLRESNFTPASDGDSQAAVTASNSFVTGRMAQQINDLSKLSGVPALLEEIKQLIGNNTVAPQAASAQTTRERESVVSSSGTAGAPSASGGKTLRVGKVNDKTESLSVWKWLEDYSGASRSADEMLLLLIEQSSHIETTDLKAIRQECMKNNIFYITAPRDAIYALKNLGADWNGKVSEEYIGTNTAGKKDAKSNQPPASTSEKPTAKNETKPAAKTEAPAIKHEPKNGAENISSTTSDTSSTSVTQVTVDAVAADKNNQSNSSDNQKPTEAAQPKVEEQTFAAQGNTPPSDAGEIVSRSAEETAAAPVVENKIIAAESKPENTAATENAATNELTTAAANQLSSSPADTDAQSNESHDLPPNQPKPNPKNGDGKQAKPRQEFATVKLKAGSGFENLEKAETVSASSPKLPETKPQTGTTVAAEATSAAADQSKDSGVQKKAVEETAVEPGSLGNKWESHFSNLLAETNMPVIEEDENPYE